MPHKEIEPTPEEQWDDPYISLDDRLDDAYERAGDYDGKRAMTETDELEICI